MRKYGIVLKHQPNVALSRRYIQHRLSIDQNIAAGRFLQPDDHIEDRRFSAAGRPQQGHCFAFFDGNRDIVDSVELAELLTQINQFQLNVSHY